MRISDWSSDVCSSDLGGVFQAFGAGEARRHHHAPHPVRPQRVDGDRRRKRAVDATRKPQHHAGKAVARHIIVQRTEEHTSELQSLMRISYAVFCLKKKKQKEAEYKN